MARMDACREATLATLQMRQEFLVIRHPVKVPPDNLMCSQSRLSAGPHAGQHARDDGTTDPNLYVVLGVARQTTAPHQMVGFRRKGTFCF